MKDVTGSTQVAVATSGVYDILGFESFLAILTLTTAYDASAVKVSVGDDSASLTELPAGDPAVVVRFEGSDGKTGKLSYIGGRRYVKIAGATVVAALLMNPLVAPVGLTEAPDDYVAPSETRSAPKAASAPVA